MRMLDMDIKLFINKKYSVSIGVQITVGYNVLNIKNYESRQRNFNLVVFFN